MALTADTIIDVYNIVEQPPIVRPPITVKSGSTIYKGAMCALNSGELIPASSTAENVGFAIEGYAAGDEALVQYDHICKLSISGVTNANLGDKVYSTADNAFQLSSSSASLVGYIVGIESTGVAYVRITLGQTV